MTYRWPSKTIDTDTKTININGLGDNFSFKYSNGDWTVSADNHAATSSDLQKAIKTVVRKRRELSVVNLADGTIGTELRTGLVGEYVFAGIKIEITADTVRISGAAGYWLRIVGTFTPGDWLVRCNHRHYIIPRCLLGEIICAEKELDRQD